MTDVSLKSVFNRPPAAAQAYLQGKGYVITDSWRDLPGEAHAVSFTVARAARLDVLQSIREELQRAQAEGLPFQAFKQNLRPRLQALGWLGKAIDTDTGEITPYPGTSRPIELGTPRRLETIYRTNLQTAYMAGRWKRFDAEARRAPYLQYIAVMDGRTRPSHAALHLRVFRFDDPVWDHIYPPNGFNCRCRVRNLSQRELDARDLKVSSSAGHMQKMQQEQKGGAIIERTTIRLPGMDRSFSADIGWDHNPGKAYMAALQALATDKLNVAATPIAIEALKDLVNSDGFRSFYAAPEGFFPIGVISDADASLIGAKAHTVQLSSETMTKQLQVHPELKAQEYSFVQQAIERGIRIQDGRRSLIYLLELDGYVTVVKATGTGRAIFMTSFRRLSNNQVKRDEEIRRLLRKGEE